MPLQNFARMCINVLFQKTLVNRVPFKSLLRVQIRVSIRGDKSLWVDRRFIPADQGSYWVICAICSF